MYLCKTCSDAVTCDECDGTKEREKNLTVNTCQCKDGWFDNGTNTETCRMCVQSCKTCNSDAACQTCEEANFRELNASLTTYCACKWKHYPSNSSHCAACHYSCRECTNGTANDCTSCETSM
jgi:proprotein convertase subtilisin/kexin type 5